MRATMHFTRLGQTGGRAYLPEGATPNELAIGQLLGLAASAGFRCAHRWSRTNFPTGFARIGSRMRTRRSSSARSSAVW